MKWVQLKADSAHMVYKPARVVYNNNLRYIIHLPHVRQVVKDTCRIRLLLNERL
jgi:hypothetical protein